MSIRVRGWSPARRMKYRLVPTMSLVLLLGAFAADPSMATVPMSLVIGIDGLSSYGLNEANTPNMDLLARGQFAGGGYRGDFTPFAYAGGVLGTSQEQATISGPGWSSILTGVWKNRHLVSDNSFAVSNFAANPTYLEQLLENVPQLHAASIVHWSPIDTHIISSVDDFNSQMDYRATFGTEAATAADAAAHLGAIPAGIPASVFVHFDNVDGAGHASGLYSANYLSTVAATDGRVGQLLTAIRNRPQFLEEAWQIIVVSDHGHRPSGGHGGQTQLERWTPMIVSRPGNGSGWLLSNPRDRSHVDVAPTVLEHFGLTVPSYFAGRAAGIGEFLPPTQSLQQGLVSHLPLDGNLRAGAAGTNAISVGNLQFIPGKFGTAVGVPSYGAGSIQLADDLGAMFGTLQDISMSLWVRFDAFTGDPAFLSNKDWNSGSNTGINLAFNPNNTLDFNTKGNGGVREDSHPYEGLDAGVWQHIAFTIDRNGPTRLFIDGALAGEIATSTLGSLDGAFNFRLLNDGTGAYTTGTVTNLSVDEFGAWNRLLSTDEILALATQPIGIPFSGDFNHDGTWDCLDIDPLVAQIAMGGAVENYDLNGDGQINLADVSAWLVLAGSQELPSGAPYLFGDASLDGNVDGTDFGIWNAAKFTSTLGWCQGDFNADGVADGSDFGIWNTAKFTSSDATAVIPEGGLSGWGLLLVALGIRGRPSKRRKTAVGIVSVEYWG
jgi:Concanavalin A-like lectin/glucanases superfamily/Type I phosphodiesterase / nucleotide pyrophosphatase